VRHGAFRLDHPFLELPNVIGSPHNSGSVPESRGTGLRRALANCRRALAGETPLHLLGEDDRL
jgi:phosphoglycerate dehydrogenase-like enzyme